MVGGQEVATERKETSHFYDFLFFCNQGEGRPWLVDRKPQGSARKFSQARLANLSGVQYIGQFNFWSQCQVCILCDVCETPCDLRLGAAASRRTLAVI